MHQIPTPLLSEAIPSPPPFYFILSCPPPVTGGTGLEGATAYVRLSLFLSHKAVCHLCCASRVPECRGSSSVRGFMRISLVGGGPPLFGVTRSTIHCSNASRERLPVMDPRKPSTSEGLRPTESKSNASAAAVEESCSGSRQTKAGNRAAVPARNAADLVRDPPPRRSPRVDPRCWGREVTSLRQERGLPREHRRRFRRPRHRATNGAFSGSRALTGIR